VSDTLISPHAAEAAIRAHAQTLPAAVTPLAELAGAVLREPIVSSRDQPPFDRVTMDGIAFAYAAYADGRRSFRIAATQGAGMAPATLPGEDACIEVMTGAMVPTGCDCIVPVEKLTVHDGVARLGDDASPTRNANIHARGVDSRQGQRLLEPGMRLGAPEVAVIASTGQSHAKATRLPSIIAISTGDELVEPGQPVAAWQIYRSNVYAVLATLARRGYSRLAHDHLPDDPDVLRTRLKSHLDAHEVLILSGGVSMGRFDYVPQVLADLGVRVIFHKVSQRPGKPLWFGVGPRGQTVYALPGNPVSTLVCLVRYVLAGLDASVGATRTTTEQVELAHEYEVKPQLTFFIPVALERDGALVRARIRPTQGSGDFTSLVGTDGFVELPTGPCVVAPGTRVPLYRWV
jgi:molybdopterin molybdotransferase